ncbi:MAG: hypothetical protein N2712_02845 [Brevinematales bacterium]|nr:hypothetical protein [Brevinematales bacterium]
MKKFLKFLFYFAVLLIVLLSILLISALSNFYNNLKHLGISTILLRDTSVILLIPSLIFITLLLIFRLRSRFILIKYYQKAELNTKHTKILFWSDIIISLLLTLFIILNLKEVYMFVNLIPSITGSFDLFNYPFILSILKTILTLLNLVLLYLIIPILYLSHKAYEIRFVSFKLVPHKTPFLIPSYGFIFFTILSGSIFIYSLVISLEIYPKYSLILTLTILFSIILLLYGLLFLVNLTRRNPMPWYLNILILTTITTYFFLVSFANNLPNISLVKLQILEDINLKQKNSKFVVNINNSNISDVFKKIDLARLESLNKLEIKDYSLPKTEKPILKITRNAKTLERIYMVLTSGILDHLVIRNIIITNYLDLETLFKTVLPTSFCTYSKVNEKNIFEVSIPYEFNNTVFFYKRYIIEWTNSSNLRVYDLVKTNYNYSLYGILSSKDYYLLTKKNKSKKSHMMFQIKYDNAYQYVIAGIGYSLVLSNENYYNYTIKDYNQGEFFAFVNGIPIFLSNITLDGKSVGMKVRYFDVEGRGYVIQESISNLIGNANYYYKVIELTNRIEILRKYIKENQDRIPPDVLENIQTLIFK